LSPTTPPVLLADVPLIDEAQLAAVAFLARYSGRTLASYRVDLRQIFQWANDVELSPLSASRAHIELYRMWMDERGLAAATVDRRLATVCGYYRFAHIDGRIRSNPAQYVRRPTVHPSVQRGMDRAELATFLFTAERISARHAALAVLLGLNGLRVSEACAANIEDLGFERGHRTLQIIGKGNKPAGIPLVPRTARTIDLAVGERTDGPTDRRTDGPTDRRTDGPILVRHDGGRLDLRTAHRWVRAIGRRAGLDGIHPHMLRAAFIMAALDAGVPLRDVQIAAPRRSTNDDDLRPAAPQLRPPRGLRRGRLRHQRLSGNHRTSLMAGVAKGLRTKPPPASEQPHGRVPNCRVLDRRVDGAAERRVAPSGYARRLDESAKRGRYMCGELITRCAPREISWRPVGKYRRLVARRSACERDADGQLRASVRPSR
jgi:integrase/recombinase XerD